jgi:hypothetical protein
VSRQAPLTRCGAAALLLVLAALQVAPGGSPATGAEPPVKPRLTGLLDRNGPPPPELADVVHDYVVQVLWRDLQPTAGGPLATEALDAAFDEARARGSRVKLRVLAGAAAPGWAKRLAGRPFQMTEQSNGRVATVPRFWTPAFGAAYADLQAQLAARYDADPVLAEVVVSRCTVFYAEPFIRHTSVGSNRAALLAAGYTRAADKACHRGEIIAHRVWATTRSGLAFNPAQLVSADGGRLVDDAFTVRMMRYCREQLGRRCVLENQSIRSPISSLDQNPAQPHYARMYEAMRAARSPIAFQTATPARIGNCRATLDWAVLMGAWYVELPHPATSVCSSRTLARAARLLGP